MYILCVTGRIAVGDRSRKNGISTGGGKCLQIWSWCLCWRYGALVFLLHVFH